MFSVIIPTMWRVPGLFLQAINNYIESEYVSEIIIIDNDTEKQPSWPELNHPKVNVSRQWSNIYVNPAWNLGASLAKNDKLCIVNDDIVFDKRLFAKMIDRCTQENGVHGMITGEAKFNHPVLTDGSIDFIEWNKDINLHGFGQLMFIHKSNWVPIDENLKIYCGDDWIFHQHLLKGLTNYLIHNLYFFSPMASTSSDKTITNGFIEKESKLFSQWFKNNPLPKKV